MLFEVEFLFEFVGNEEELIMTGLAYTAHDDCVYLEEQMNRNPIVSVKRHDLKESFVKSQLSWAAVEQALIKAGIVREDEMVVVFNATHDGLQIVFEDKNE